MKKLITIILFIFSMQIFAGQYQVIKQKNVTLSKEQIDLENKKIEKMLYSYDNEKPKKILESKLPQLKNKFNKNNKNNHKYSNTRMCQEYCNLYFE